MNYTIFFDFETSGLQANNPPIQLAAIVIRDEDWEEVNSFEAKLQFKESDADPAALAMNHYDAAVWQEKAISQALCVARFTEWAKSYLSIQMVSARTGKPYMVGKLAGHNALTFDLPRLRQMYGTGFFPYSYHVKDTLQRALWYFDEHPEVKRPENLKLGTLCATMGICIDGAHDALADVRMSAALARAFSLAERGTLVNASSNLR